MLTSLCAPNKWKTFRLYSLDALLTTHNSFFALAHRVLIHSFSLRMSIKRHVFCTLTNSLRVLLLSCSLALPSSSPSPSLPLYTSNQIYTRRHFRFDLFVLADMILKQNECISLVLLPCLYCSVSFNFFVSFALDVSRKFHQMVEKSNEMKNNANQKCSQRKSETARKQNAGEIDKYQVKKKFETVKNKRAKQSLHVNI